MTGILCAQPDGELMSARDERLNPVQCDWFWDRIMYTGNHGLTMVHRSLSWWSFRLADAVGAAAGTDCGIAVGAFGKVIHEL